MSEYSHAFYRTLYGDIPLIKAHKEDPEVFVLEQGRELPCRLLFVLRRQDSDEAYRQEMDMLQRMAAWKALELNPGEVWVMHITGPEVSFIKIRERLRPPNLICFGLNPRELGLQTKVESNTLFPFLNCRFIFAPPLNQLQQDEKLKNQFFRKALEPMFSRTEKK